MHHFLCFSYFYRPSLGFKLVFLLPFILSSYVKSCIILLEEEEEEEEEEENENKK
jgi:hypothetical protein